MLNSRAPAWTEFLNWQKKLHRLSFEKLRTGFGFFKLKERGGGKDFLVSVRPGNGSRGGCPAIGWIGNVYFFNVPSLGERSVRGFAFQCLWPGLRRSI